jgi:hypothetical protein
VIDDDFDHFLKILELRQQHIVLSPVRRLPFRLVAFEVVELNR